jgi:hypothetical protein
MKVLICQRLRRSQGLSAARKIKLMENPNILAGIEHVTF